jgi:hypothetical protein
MAPSGEAAQQRIREVLGFTEMDPVPVTIQRGITWERDGLAGEEITWSVGYGPKTAAWILKPAEATQPLPGVIALHGHDGVKFFGKEKIANGKERAPAAVENLRADLTKAEPLPMSLPGRALCSSRMMCSCGGAAAFRLRPCLNRSIDLPKTGARHERRPVRTDRGRGLRGRCSVPRASAR